MSAVGVLALAAAAVSLFVGAAVRRGVAAIVIVAALAALWRCIYVLLHRGSVTVETIRRQLEASSVVGSSKVVMSAWPWIAVLGCVLVVAGSAVALATAGRWPRSSRRYETATASGPIAPAGKASAEPVDVSDAMWKALDRGEDPTDAPGEADRS